MDFNHTDNFERFRDRQPCHQKLHRHMTREDLSNDGENLWSKTINDSKRFMTQSMDEQQVALTLKLIMRDVISHREVVEDTNKSVTIEELSTQLCKYLVIGAKPNPAESASFVMHVELTNIVNEVCEEAIENLRDDFPDQSVSTSELNPSDHMLTTLNSCLEKVIPQLIEESSSLDNLEGRCIDEIRDNYSVSRCFTNYYTIYDELANDSQSEEEEEYEEYNEDE